MTRQGVHGVAWGCFAGLLCLFAAVWPARAETGWFMRAWRSDDGLPNNTVNGIAQTQDGYLWLATPGGLVAFDGIHFQTFSLRSVGQEKRIISAMLLDRQGGLTLAMDRNDVVYLDGSRTHTYKITNAPPDRIPTDIVEDGDGTLWIACHGGGVYILRNGQSKYVNASDGLASGQSIPTLAADNRGHMWFCKNGAFGRIHDDFFQTLSQLDQSHACLAAARDGGLWVGTSTGLYKYSSNSILTKVSDFSGTDVSVILEDRSGAVWVGTSGSGLYRYTGAGLQKVTTSHSQILSLLQDAEGNLWVGTGGGGLDRLRPQNLELKGADTGLPEAVQSIGQDTNGTIWATTQNGLLVHLAGEKWVPMESSNTWPGGATCVLPDPSGAVWVGTEHHGLYCWQDGRLTAYDRPEGLHGHTIRALLLDHNGGLWIGEENPLGLQKLQDGKFTTVKLPPDSRIIRAFAEDPAGNLWAGTSRGALLKITNDQATDETTNLLGIAVSIRYLYTTPDGIVWIGFAGGGLGRLKDGKVTRITQAEGLLDDYISQIVADGQGWLWFGANRGVFKAREKDLNSVATGAMPRLQTVHYGSGEGLPSLEATYGNSPGALCSRDGRIWIPMRTGMVVANPDTAGEELPPPPVLLKRMTVDDQVLALYNGVFPLEPDGDNPLVNLGVKDPVLRVSPYHRRIQFDFTAFSFSAPENIQFRYRLLGLNDDWINLGAQRDVAYPHLPAASYRFEVQASDANGDWSQAGTGLNFEVLPFYWQTAWFRVAVFTLFTLIMVAAVRYISVRRLQAQLRLAEQQSALHKERARIAKDIHDDLGATLTQIAIFSELARRDSDQPVESRGHNEKISQTARQAIRALDEIVWAVNPRNDTLTQLVDYTGQFALDYLESAGIRCRLDFPDSLPEREVPTDLRHNLFLVVKEALNNVVKHAQAKEVSLRLSSTAERLDIEIEDNGRGLGSSPDAPGADGLRNMRQRMHDIGGECRIESRPGGGTRITVAYRWPP